MSDVPYGVNKLPCKFGDGHSNTQFLISYWEFHMVSPQTVFTYPPHKATSFTYM